MQLWNYFPKQFFNFMELFAWDGKVRAKIWVKPDTIGMEYVSSKQLYEHVDTL